MQTETGKCTACGAKNSRFVQDCYRCQRPLPWSSNYSVASPPSVAPPPHNFPPRNAIPPQPQPSVPPVVQPGFVPTAPPQKSSEVRLKSWHLAAMVGGGVLFGMVIVGAFLSPRLDRKSIPKPTGRTPDAAPTASPTVVVPTPQKNVLLPTSAPVAAPTPRQGPSFHEADAYFDDRKTDLTDAQKQDYWTRISGTQVTWRGAVVEVRMDSGGSISMRCNPETMTSDVQVTLDGTQTSLLPSINKGQYVTVKAILQDHSSFGYTLARGQIVDP